MKHFLLSLAIAWSLLALPALGQTAPAFERLSGPSLPAGPAAITEDSQGRILISVTGNDGATAAIEGNSVRVIRRGRVDAAAASPIRDQFGNQWTVWRSPDGNDQLAACEADSHEWRTLTAMPQGWRGEPVEDVAGFLWVAGDHLLMRLDPRAKEPVWKSFPIAKSGPLDDGAITTLGTSPDGLAMVACGGRLLELDWFADGNAPVRPIDAAALPDPVRAFYCDSRGDVWAVAGDAVYRRPAPAAAWQRHWHALARMPFGDHDISAAIVDGKVYIPGGMACHGLGGAYKYFNTTLVYDASADRWTQAAQMPVSVCYSGVAAMGGKVWSIGGGLEDGKNRLPTPRVEIFDPAANRWDSGPALDVGRMEAVAAEAGGRIYVVGGCDPNGKTLSTMLSIGPGDTSWRREPNLPLPMRQFAGCAAAGKIYVMVGAKAPPAKGFFAYDTATRQWQTDLPQVPTGKCPRAAVVAALNDEVWVMGGQDVADSRATWIYSPAKEQWRAGPSLPYPCSWGAAVAVNGRLIVAGGACEAPRYRGYIFWNRAWELRASP